MKGHKFKKLFGFFAFAIMPIVCMSFADTNVKAIGTEISSKRKIGSGSDNVQDITGTTTDPKQYVGYGFNAAGKKALYEPDALMLNNPILDTTNPLLQNAIKVFDGSKTEYVSTSKTSAKEIAKDYGKTIGAGLGGGGNIAMVNIDVNAKFNMGNTESWGKISNEEFSYYTIFAGNRPVVLQMEFGELGNFLTPQFKKDLYAVNSNLAAENLYKKYGTHLLTGYTMGGIFEMTNYYATNSDTYVKENEIGFDVQVNAGLSSLANGNLDFSFNNKYGYKDNNSHAINQYKCTTYGGLTFPGLTIDQAFSWYETLAGAGFVYQLWTDSINAGKNLVIVDIPQSSKMIPLWDLLPLDENYNARSRYLRDSYRKLSSSAYKEFDTQHPSHFKTGLGNEANFRDDLVFEDRGFDLENYVGTGSEGNDRIKTYVDAQNITSDKIFNVKPGSRISMLYDTANFAEQHAKWKIEQTPIHAGKDTILPVKIIDDYYGVFEVNKISEDGINFTAIYEVNGLELFRRTFSISKSKTFCGGGGTEVSPYLISTPEEYYYFSESEEFWQEGVYVKLISDIDLDEHYGNGNNNCSYPNIVGRSSDNKNKVKYYGVFDGAYHTITKPVPNSIGNEYHPLDTYFASGLFYNNAGTIKNLNVNYKKNINVYKGIQSYIAGIACINEGTIENCTVKDFYIHYNNVKGSNVDDQVNLNSQNNLFIGGISCYSTGLIKKCVVNNMDVYANVEDKTDKKLDNVYVGGISAYTENSIDGPSRVEACESNHFSAFVDGSNIKNTKFEIFESPFIGSGLYTNVSHALVKELDGTYYDVATDVDKEIKFTDTTLSLSYKLNTSSDKKAFLGGLFGSIGDKGAEGNVNIDNVVLLLGKDKNPKIRDIDKKNIENQNDCAVLIGRNHINVKAKLNLSNIYCQNNKQVYDTGKNLIGYNIIGNKKSDDTSFQNYILNSKEQFNRTDYGYEIRNNNDTWGFAENDPSIKLCLIRKETLSLNTEKVQKKFDIGESFKSENLEIRGYLEDGNMFTDNALIVDAHEFYAPEGGLRTEQKYGINIFVKYLDSTYSYTVDVVNPTVKRLYLVEKEKPEDIYAGQSIDDFDFLKHVELHEMLSNGKDNLVKEGFTCSVPKGRFVEGNNDITISYKGTKTVYHVDAKERTLIDIRVKNKDSFVNNENLSFNVGTRNIDFTDIPDLIIEGKYLDKNPNTSARVAEVWERIDPKQCEFTYSKINLGENTVTVSYGLTEIQTQFNVTGLYKINAEIVNNFTTFIETNIGLDPNNTEKYDSLSMVDRFNILNEGYRLLAEIGFDYREPQVEIDGVLTDTKFTKARAIYMLKKDEYNKVSENINQGFNETLKVGGSMNNALLIAGGFTAFLQIISILIKAL